MVKRYQVYLNPHSVSIFDEVAEISDYTRSQLLREAIDSAASRLGNLLALLKPRVKDDYEWLNSLVGSIKIKGKRQVNISGRVDDLYYGK